MSLSELLSQAGLDKEVKIPPVEKWNPELSGDMDMIVRKDGTWWHEGGQIKRQELVRLFASILKREGDDHFLVTPVEKWRIRIEDRPLLVAMVEFESDGIRVLTNGGDSFVVGNDHPLIVSELDGVEVPEVLVRANLWARFSRNAFYQLSDWAVEEAGRIGVVSGGRFFSLESE